MHTTPARRIFEVLAILFILLAMAWQPAEAQDDDVKYCQDLTTGEIAVVKAGAPCPYPMAEM